MLHSYSTKHSYSLLQSCQSCQRAEWHPVNQVGHIVADMTGCKDLNRYRVKGIPLIPQHPDFSALQLANEGVG